MHTVHNSCHYSSHIIIAFHRNCTPRLSAYTKTLFRESGNVCSNVCIQFRYKVKNRKRAANSWPCFCNWQCFLQDRAHITCKEAPPSPTAIQHALLCTSYVIRTQFDTSISTTRSHPLTNKVRTDDNTTLHMFQEDSARLVPF